MIRKIFICFVIFTIGINGLRRRCINTGVLFSDKILRSSIIVYGESLAKQTDIETEMELLFNITFRVDCIFKGENIENRIEIIDAGIKTDRTACQWLDSGKFYVVFLEKCGLNKNTYCPLDFQERLVDDITYELLEKTCHLKRIPPIHSISYNCPNVSMTEFCSNDEINVKILPKGKNFDDINNQFYLQSNITKPKKGGSLIDQFADNPRSHASLSTLICIRIIILTVITTMFI